MVVTRSGMSYDFMIPPKPKQPRALSQYNLFIRDSLKTLKDRGIKDHRKRFKLAVEMWKQLQS